MEQSNHLIIQTLTYTTVERFIDRHEQKQLETIHNIYLYTHEISTTNRTFKLEYILDLSYRPFSGQKGLLYLHTHEGVFTYEIDADPQPFIHAYKRLRGDFGY